MRSNILFLVILLALSELTLTSTAAGREALRRSPSTLSLSTSASTFDLTTFGAVGDGIADDGPALQSALNAIANAGGGTLMVPAGRYAIITPVRKDFSGLSATLTILGVASSTPVNTQGSGQELTRGLDLTSEFVIKTGTGTTALTLVGLDSLLISEMVFIGTPEAFTDAQITLGIYSVANAVIRHCEFYGLSTIWAGGAIVHADNSSLMIERTVFLGCTGNSGVRNSVVLVTTWKAFSISESIFADYGQRPNYYGKLGLAAPFSWIMVGNTAAVSNLSPRREATIRNVFLDEGGFFGISAIPDYYDPQNAGSDLIYISALRMNVSSLHAAGIYVHRAKRVLIERAKFGLSIHADAAVSLANVGEATLDRLECLAASNRIRATAATGRLTVINSIYTHLDSLAQTTEVITTATEAEDAVQYVRQKYLDVLEHEPDAAGHDYWADQLLDCHADVTCLAAKRLNLLGYLGTEPSPLFSVTGRILNQAGAGLAGVALNLTGSQAVTTQTDNAGNYRFEGLPTSGVYTVTPVRVHYTFNPSTWTTTTPSGNRVANFSANFTGTLKLLEFSDASYHIVEGETSLVITVVRHGDASSPGSATYSTSDDSSLNHCSTPDTNFASSGCDYMTAIGTLHFAAGETSKTFSVPIIEDGYAEGSESFEVNLSNLVGAEMGSHGNATVTISDNETVNGTNPIETASSFVRQHYIDFFNREPDAAGLAFWTNQITSCGTDAACVELKRTNVSAAFFLSMEFRDTGYLVYRMYKAAHGNLPGAPVPVRFEEFLPDTQRIGLGVAVGLPGWAELLDSNTQAYAADFVARSRFTDSHSTTLTPAQFVDALFANAGVVPSADERTTAINEFGIADTSADIAARARALRRVAGNQTFAQQEFNKAFVLMQYFGYLRRNPNDAPESTLDFQGFNFWLGKLNQFNGNFVNAQMVKAFIISSEYRQRFGP